jgi:hypothetical protein
VSGSGGACTRLSTSGGCVRHPPSVLLGRFLRSEHLGLLDSPGQRSVVDCGKRISLGLNEVLLVEGIEEVGGVESLVSVATRSAISELIDHEILDAHRGALVAVRASTTAGGRVGRPSHRLDGRGRHGSCEK